MKQINYYIGLILVILILLEMKVPAQEPVGTYHSGYGKVYQVYLDPVKGKAYYNRTKTAKFYFSKKVTAKFLVK
jgi:hypothetical protein